MGLLSAFVKTALRYGNDKLTEHETQKAKSQAFQVVGDKINQAKEKKKFFNAKQTYATELEKRMALVNQRSKRREQGIDDL